MARKLSAHVALTHGLDLVRFAPGDDLPEWAEGLVGEHALEPEKTKVGTAEVEVTADDDDEDVLGEPSEVEKVVSEEQGLDFTKPARRGPGRPRKS